jgi:hypothetical protein
MIAVYVTYDIETGEVISLQKQYKGVAPKVADWPRDEGESAVRYTGDLIHTNMSDLRVVNEDGSRNLYLGGSKVKDEDKENSTVYVTKIEDL